MNRCIGRKNIGIVHVISIVTVLSVLSLTVVACGASDDTFADDKFSYTFDPAGNTYPPFAFSTFPYDFTAEAIHHTNEIADEWSGVYVVQLDNGIPWSEALNDAPYPQKVRETWDDYRGRAPKTNPVYLALAPLGEDRETLIRASEGSKHPDRLKGLSLDHKDLKTAYTNYALRAVKEFSPTYVNLGLEAGELAFRNPKRWPEFISLYKAVRNTLKESHPDLQIGISFGLQSLMESSVQKRIIPIIEASDFIGISFYPYMSKFHERFGTSALPSPPEQWRAPLRFLRDFSDIPIAICETGYSSNDISLRNYRLSLSGSPTLQQQYLRELAEIARRDSYLFVVWFMPIDYEKLFEKLPKGDGSYLLWQNIGLFDQHLTEKPAWADWKAIRQSSEPQPVPTQTNKHTKLLSLGFDHSQQLFTGSSSDLVTLARRPDGKLPHSNTGESVMKWSFDYKKSRWQWIAKTVSKGTFSSRSQISFQLKSDQTGPILFQLEESDGESFYTLLNPGESSVLVELSISDFLPDPSKKRDGVLNLDTINKIMFADAGAVTEHASGSRNIWIGDIAVK